MSISAVDDAMVRVNAMRANFGALQNRMQSTISNLAISEENLSAANSIIRDTDIAKESAELTKNNIYSSKIVTSLEPFKKFYQAEEYHQNYYENNKNQPYCQMVIQPKIEKFEKVFKDRLKKKQ